MNQYTIILMAALLAAGCTANQQQLPTDKLLIAFGCDRGENLDVAFYPQDERAVLHWRDQQYELPQQRSASGFWYASTASGVSLRGKGDALTVEHPDRPPLHCIAAAH